MILRTLRAGGHWITNTTMSRFGPTYVMRSRRPVWRPVLKRIADIVFASIFCVLFLPLILFIAAILSWHVGPRNVIYVHRRVGRHGIPFGCLKFRSMVVDSDARLAELLAGSVEHARQWADNQKLNDDPRIIPGIGNILRRSSLDELPQILNVLRGEMSLVGPRPVTEAEMKHYGTMRRLYERVRPGMTGPWQIGSRSQDTYAHRVELDVAYVRGWTLSGDFRIILRTAKILSRFTNNTGAF